MVQQVVLRVPSENSSLKLKTVVERSWGLVRICSSVSFNSGT